MAISHKTIISEADKSARAILAVSRDGVVTNTRAEITPIGEGLFRIQIEQLEREPRHKRGVSKSVSFVISRAGLEHLCSVPAL